MITATEVRERPILFNGEMVRAILDGRKTQTRRVVTPQPEHRQVYDWNGRRLYDGEARLWCYRQHVGADNWDSITQQIGHACPYGQPGDRLWVRETWTGMGMLDGEDRWWHEIPKSLRGPKWPEFLHYAADDALVHAPVSGEQGPWEWRRSTWEPHEEDLEGRKWQPSIFMPRWASRITLEVTDVRVERVRDISELDAKAEGARAVDLHDPAEGYYPPGSMSYREGFAELWDSINAARGYGWDANPWVWAVTFRRLP